MLFFITYETLINFKAHNPNSVTFRIHSVTNNRHVHKRMPTRRQHTHAHTHAELGGDWVISATYITSLPLSFPLKTFSSAMTTNFLYSSRSRYFVNSLFINISGTLIDKSYPAGIQTLYLCTVDKLKVCFSMFLHINRPTCRNRLCFSALWDSFYCPSIR